MNSELAAKLPKLGPDSSWEIQPTILPGQAIVRLFVNKSFIDSAHAIPTMDGIAQAANVLATRHASLIASSQEYVDRTLFGEYFYE